MAEGFDHCYLVSILSQRPNVDAITANKRPVASDVYDHQAFTSRYRSTRVEQTDQYLIDKIELNHPVPTSRRL
jgi:hypothetical protein